MDRHSPAGIPAFPASDRGVGPAMGAVPLVAGLGEEPVPEFLEAHFSIQSINISAGAVKVIAKTAVQKGGRVMHIPTKIMR